MSKTKLTLYIDEEINKLAHRRAKLSGKSISTLVREYFVQKEKEIKSKEISDKVANWIGILDIKINKSYKELREDHINSRLKRYEDID